MSSEGISGFQHVQHLKEGWLLDNANVSQALQKRKPSRDTCKLPSVANLITQHQSRSSSLHWPKSPTKVVHNPIHKRTVSVV